MPERIAKQIHNKIKNSEHVLLVPHKDPDGDALGSVTALMHILKKMSKKHSVFCATDADSQLNFLPYVEELTTDEAVWKNPFDLVIIVDSGDLERAGMEKFVKNKKDSTTVINIDHHNDNTHFGDLNLVIPSASSTTHILYDLFKANNVEIDSQTATCLLTGLITDTGNFTNAATTVESLDIASDLVRKGGDIKMIKRLVFQDKSIDTLKLWGAALSRLSKHDAHEIVYTYLTQDDLKEYGVNESEAKGIANFMNVLNEGKAALILKERDQGKIKGSFRTTQDDIDVSKIARKLGGGGHKKAAGFSIDGNMEEVLEKVWQAIEEHKNNENK